MSGQFCTLAMFFLLQIRIYQTFQMTVEGSGKDCLSWCYVFVPLFGDFRVLLAVFGGVLLSMVTCQGLVAFSLGMVALVFWTLTFLQCPLTPSHYRDMCDADFECWDSLLLYCWPSFSAFSLGFSGLLHLQRRGLLGISLQRKRRTSNCKVDCRRSTGEDSVPAKVSNGGLALIHPAPPLTPSNWGSCGSL